jgi:FAD synthase
MSMRLYSTLQDVADAPANGRAVAIGVFDGVHRGHQLILAQTIEQARASGAFSTAVTFYPHPDSVLRPRSAPRMLTSLERKAELLDELGMDEMVVVRFDREFASLSPELFCRAVLSDHLGAKQVFVGQNFRFGHFGGHLQHTHPRASQTGTCGGGSGTVGPATSHRRGGRPRRSTGQDAPGAYRQPVRGS